MIQCVKLKNKGAVEDIEAGLYDEAVTRRYEQIQRERWEKVQR